jgi:hypothetical protein
MREFGEGEKRALEEDDSRESTPAVKKIKKAGNKLVESLKVKSSLHGNVADCSISRVRV